MIDPELVLETPRLILRPVRLEDAPRLADLAQPLEVVMNTLTMPHPYPPECATEFTKRMVEAAAKGEACCLTLAVKQPDVGHHPIIGCIGLHIEKLHQHAEVGYALGREYWGRGYANEALTEVIRYGFETLNLHRIHASYFSRNPASGRVLEKCGFRYEGTRPEMFFRFGSWVDCILVGLLKSDWMAQRQPPA